MESNKAGLSYQNENLPFEERAEDLVSRMSIEDCVAQMLFAAPKLEELGIPAYNWWNEALHGVARAGLATVFPQAIGLAASFDPVTLKQVAEIIATEGRAKYNEFRRQNDRDIYKGLTFWSPNINIFRDPRWGRGQETFGEDPWLTGLLGDAFVRGLQGDNPRYLKAAACAKHYAVHSGPESLRHEFDAEVSDKDLWETYLPAFEKLACESGVEGFMGAYNLMNGEPCCGHSVLGVDILRNKWGFKGYFTTDCGAIADFHLYHKICATAVESVSIALKNGTDLNCGNMYGNLLIALKEGLISEEQIRTAAYRLMRTRMRLGMFDKSTPWDHLSYMDVDTPENRAANLAAAQKTLVLLKNENGFLPVDKKSLKTVAVIGPNAMSAVALEGNYCGTAGEYHTIYDGIREALPEDVRVFCARGCHLTGDRTESLSALADDRISEAVAVAGHADMIILAVGLDQYIEGEEMEHDILGLKGDKPDLLLPGPQRRLLTAVCNTGKPVVIVNMSGSAIDLADGNEKAAAIIQAWYPGAEGGRAVAGLIFGDYSPSGRLPVTFYHNGDPLPEFTDYAMEGRTYRFLKREPLYPFGYGLSYTSFSYSDLSAPEKIAAGEALRCSVRVKNTGGMDGEEVVQLYLKIKGADVRVPNYGLCGARRVFLQKGEETECVFEIAPSSMFVYADDGSRRVHLGEYTIYAGGSQPDDLSHRLTGNAVLSRSYIVG